MGDDVIKAGADGHATSVESALRVQRRSYLRLRYPTLIVLLFVETLAFNVARLPASMRFDGFAFCDSGANLTLQYLISNGLRPSLDFGYHYGLLPALIGRIWFSLFGTTPWAYQAAMLTADLLCAWALARIIHHLKIGGIGLVFAFVTLGYAFQASYVNFAHATETVLLSHALAQQSCGKRSGALALATAAIFAKPSMGFVYGLLLVILIARDSKLGSSASRHFFRALAPAVMVFVGLSALLILTYGFATFFHTLLPIEGAVAYRSLGYGFFASGKNFWAPDNHRWLFYLIDISGLWIAATFLLIGLALTSIKSFVERTALVPKTEILVTCAAVHLAFLLLFFGNQWSWIYYAYVLMIGTTIAFSVLPRNSRIGLAFCALAVLSWTDTTYWTHRLWQTTAPDEVTAGLWAAAVDRDEWLTVRRLMRGEPALALDTMGATELLFPGFESPVSLYLARGLMTRGDIDRKLDQLSKAQVAVVPITITTCSGVPDAPEFKDALRDFDLEWAGKHFEVFRRRGLAAK